MTTNIIEIINDTIMHVLRVELGDDEARHEEIAREIRTGITARLNAHALRVALIELEGELPKNEPSPATIADVAAVFERAGRSSSAEPSPLMREIAELIDTYKRDRNWSDVTLYESQANAQRLMFKIAELERRVLALQGQTVSAAVKAEAKLTAQHHAEIGNDFAWAMRALKNGMHVKRIGWPNRLVIELRAVTPQTSAIYGVVLPREGQSQESSYMNLPQADLLAEDWILASDDTAELTST